MVRKIVDFWVSVKEKGGREKKMIRCFFVNVPPRGERGSFWIMYPKRFPPVKKKCPDDFFTIPSLA